MYRSWPRVASTLQAAIALTMSAFGQSVAEPGQIAAIKQLFDSAPSTPQLRCDISQGRPSLDFDFRFHAGYMVDIPLAQLLGSGHGLIIHTRVTPEGRDPVYLTKTQALPDVPATNVDAETSGIFIVGEGTYGVEVLVEDDQHRSCRSAWQIHVVRAGSERRLKPTTPPGTVEEFSEAAALPPNPGSGPRIARLTILMHAAPLVPDLSALQPYDVDRLTSSLSSLLREMPAQKVRLIAFNLDQRAIVFRADDFETSQMSALTDALNHLELGLVDYRVMRDRPQPIDLLLGLVRAELQDPAPPDALLFLGPRTRMQDDITADALGKRPATSPPVFYLQHQYGRLLPPGARPGAIPRPRALSTGAVTGADGAALEQLMPPPPIDTVDRLVGRLKGQTIPIQTAHDLADAIQRMDPRILKNAPPAPAPASEKVTAPHPLPPPAPTETASAKLSDITGDEDPVEVLMHLRDQVVQHGERIPNHTCVEAIQRDRYEPAVGRAPKSCDNLLARRKQDNSPGRLKLGATDWLRLDVALASTGEIYSWAGASRFEEIEIDELVPEGAMGTGPFATMLLGIFSNRRPKYTFEGETSENGRRIFEYSFAVPQEESRYRVKARKEWMITGYTGTIIVDPKTSELVRLVVRTEELPPATGSCETDTSLEYGLVRLGAAGYLLPKVARQRFIGRDGAEDENTMTFSACREYHAESRVAFGEGAQSIAGQAGSVALASQLPAGLPVTVELMTAVRFGHAAAGDRIEGRLAGAIRDERQQTLIAAGALLHGRLMRVETGYIPRVQRTVALRWETVQIGDAMVPLSLLPNRRPASLRTGAGNVLRRRGMEIELPLPGESHYGVFHLPAERTVLESGVRSEWITAKPQ